jgi:transcriptional regulator with XRE-family HTH domain
MTIEAPAAPRFGVWLASARRQAGLSSAAVAARAGWTGAYVRYVEAGERAAPGAAEAATVALAIQDLPEAPPPHVLRGRLAREELWWAWSGAHTRLARDLAAAVWGYDVLAKTVARSVQAEYHLTAAETPDQWPRPALVDFLCRAVRGVQLDDHGIAVYTTPGGAWWRPLD